MSNEIVWYHSDEVGAPTLNNAAGSLIAVLDACLLTGFRPQTLTSVSVTASVATATLAGHAYDAGKMVDIAGATPAGLNGRRKIISTTSGTFTFDATGVANGAASGTITAKRSPLGWAKAATGTNKAIYARTDVTAALQCLRLDDTAAGVASATNARAVMVESWTDVDSYTAPTPTAAQLSGGQYWSKGANSATAKKWLLVGDGKTFYFFTDNINYSFAGYGGLFAQSFGDLIPYRAGDAYPTFIAGGAGDSQQSYITRAFPIASQPADFGLMVARSASQIGSALQMAGVGPTAGTPVGTQGPTYPSPVDNGMILYTPVMASERSDTFGHPVRGILPGLAHPMANLQPHAVHMLVLPNLVGSSKEYLLVKTAYLGSGVSGALAFDITGPWQ